MRDRDVRKYAVAADELRAKSGSLRGVLLIAEDPDRNRGIEIGQGLEDDLAPDSCGVSQRDGNRFHAISLGPCPERSEGSGRRTGGVNRRRCTEPPARSLATLGIFTLRLV